MIALKGVTMINCWGGEVKIASREDFYWSIEPETAESLDRALEDLNVEFQFATLQGIADVDTVVCTWVFQRLDYKVDSQDYDPPEEWQEDGYLDRAVLLFERWIDDFYDDGHFMHQVRATSDREALVIHHLQW